MVIDRNRGGADNDPMSTSMSSGSGADLAAIARWTAWVAALMREAGRHATDPSDQWVLEGAATDAEWLRHRADQAAGGWLDDEQVDTVREIFELWAANHDRHEQLAARVDPAGYRMWRQRSTSARPPYLRDPDAQMVGSGASMAAASSAE